LVAFYLPFNNFTYTHVTLGNGVMVINKWSQIPRSAKHLDRSNAKAVVIAQDYISNPCLLFNKTKFDLRVYALITSFYPLRVYIFNNGLVRFASEPFTSDAKSLDNMFVHITNYCINKKSQSYQVNNDVNLKRGHKWALQTLFKYLNEAYPNLNVDNLWQQIIDIVIKTLLNCRPAINGVIKKYQRFVYNSFELLGFDIMLDSNFKPWLLEVNVSPSLRSESTLDTHIKVSCIPSTINNNFITI